MLPLKGVDISTFNGSVDIEALKKEVGFVIIRCGYGSDYSSQDDDRYAENLAKCKAAGMPYGVYLYSYARDTAMALSEARHTLRLLEGADPSYGVWYDIEDQTLPSGEALIQNCLTYCRAIEEAGYYCGIYASLYFWNNKLNDGRLDMYDKWVAQWASSNSYAKPYGIWQYTDSGVINGRQFDMNLAYKDYPAITGSKEEEIDMTKDEVIALIRSEALDVYNKEDSKYKTIDTVPSWARSDVEKVYNELELMGSDGSGNKVDASFDYVRMLTVIARLLDKVDETLKQAKEAAAAEKTPEAKKMAADEMLSSAAD